MKTLVSINILNFNTYEKSKTCIESCLQQKGIAYTIVLIDNHSTDGSYEKLRQEYTGKIEFLYNDENYGFAKGNNIGIRYCRKLGVRYSLLLNSDTELKGDYLLKSMLETITTVKDCAIVAPKIYTVTHHGFMLQPNDSDYLKLLRIGGVIPKNKTVPLGFRTLSVAHGSALFVDNDKFIEIGGFPEHYFMYCEELTFAKKILWNNYLICENTNKEEYVLHHHDKTDQVASWRLFLMGRNLSLEFLENNSSKKIVWSIVFYLYYLKQFLIGLLKSDQHFYKGMKEGGKLYRRSASKKECFQQALLIKENYK